MYIAAKCSKSLLVKFKKLKPNKTLYENLSWAVGRHLPYGIAQCYVPRLNPSQ